MSLKIIILLSVTALTMSACTLLPSPGDPPSVVTPPVATVPPVTASGSEEIRVSAAEVSFSGGLLKLDTQMGYLDSLNKKYEKAAIGSLLAKYPKNIVYFYPKDGTPNCTIQAIDFSRLQKEFNAAGVGIIGVSKDNLDSHKEFALRNELTIPLLRDDASMLLGAYGALGPMTTYGNGEAVTDIVRSTYLVDSRGLPLAAWKNVVAKGHADRIYEFVKSGK
jgi:thioredoxin-dependent peroxiredoxin